MQEYDLPNPYRLNPVKAADDIYEAEVDACWTMREAELAAQSAIECAKAVRAMYDYILEAEHEN